MQLEVLGFHHHAVDTDQADKVHIRLRRDIHADRDAVGADDQFLGHDQADIEVFDRQADGAGIGAVVFVDAAVAGGVAPIRPVADETKSVVDADRQGGDDGLVAVGQDHALGAAFGEGHRRRELHKPGQVDGRVTDLGLDDLFGEIDEDHVVATGGQRESCAVDKLVLVAVFAAVEHAVAVEVFGEILEARREFVVDRRRAKQLDRGVDLWRRRRQEKGVDIDFDIFHPHVEQVAVDADQ